ncbi:MAG: hypothetical protein HND44_14570 [Chloroflexi bacterium]|nr:hypothetical protein [Ardenticatenaceae bacterium]NOG35768.1 hypothetical protein [Chloroflexota bacterium]
MALAAGNMYVVVTDRPTIDISLIASKRARYKKDPEYGGSNPQTPEIE